MENPVLGNFSSPLTGVESWNFLPHEEFSCHSKMMSDHLMVSEGHMDHHSSFLAMKTQGIDEVVLPSSVRDLYFSDPMSVPNELIVEQSVEVGVDDEDPRIILVPNNQIIKQEGEVVISSGDVESEEVIIGGPMDSSLVDHFAIGSSIDIGSDDAAGFEDDTKLIIDTEDHYGLGEQEPEEEEEEMSTPCIPFNCADCGLLFKSRGALRRHVHSLHKPKNSKKSSREKASVGPQRYVCTTCPYTSQRRDKLDRHMEKHVMKDGMHPCGKKRHKPSELPQRHRHNAEEYHCPLCPYTCTVYRALKKHNKVHTSNTIQYSVKVSCKVCGKDRPSEAKMTKHMAKHRKGEFFLCDLCPFSSVQLKKIIQHRRMHTGEKPHLCPHCDYRSARRDNLRSHVRRMHKRANMYIDTFNPNGEESALVVN